MCVRTHLILAWLFFAGPVLAVPDFVRPFKLEVDASAYGAGAVLLQEDDHGIDHPVCYYSKNFNKHRVNYSAVETDAFLFLGHAHPDAYCKWWINKPIIFGLHLLWQ